MLHQNIHTPTLKSDGEASTRAIRRIRRAGLVSALCLGSLLVAGCSSDDDTSGSDVGAAVSDAVSDVSGAVDSVTDGTNDEGVAKDLGEQVAERLRTSPTAGEPEMTSINDAITVVVAPNKVTGLEDTDSDGKDDDAKFTIESESGDDKACVQSQDGAWEVTDDEC